MKPNTRFMVGMREIWLRGHWLIMAVAVFLLSLLELPEIKKEPSFFSDPIHVLELMLHGVILPVMLVTLQRTETRRYKAVNTLSLHDSFIYQLNKARNWEELIEIIVQFPRNIVPLSGIRLLIYSSDSNKFDLELARIFETNVQMAGSQTPLKLEDMECSQFEINKIEGVRICNCPFQLQNRDDNNFYKRYCLPLPNANSIVGVLHLILPLSYKLREDQKGFLNSIVPEIAISINKALLQRKFLLQDAAIETERLRLASDLHDTLGQDLAYLRNKIDQLIQSSSFRKTPFVQQELNQMRIVAEEANQTVRNIVAVTHSNHGTLLDDRLLAYAKAIAERAKLDISLESHGQTQILNPHMQFQIFLIFREVLANIEKHARAHRVMIALTWSDEELAMAISDDGIGFMPDHLDKNNHFGLTIIETRTREMNGHMSVVSAPHEGTTVSIRLPIIHDGSLPSEESITHEENYSG